MRDEDSRACSKRPRAWTYRPTEFQALLESTRHHLEDRTFLAVHWAMKSGTTVETRDLEDQLQRAAGIADATLVWNWPIGVHFLEEQRGIFGASESTSADYRLMSFWPGRQQDHPGTPREEVLNANGVAWNRRLSPHRVPRALASPATQPP